MRILMLQRFDLSSVSCARRVLCQARELLRRGHEVILADHVHSERQRELPAVADLSPWGARILPLERRIGRAYVNWRLLHTLQPRPEIIHLWKSYPDASLPAIFFSRRWRIPLHYDWDDWEPGIAAELTGSRWAGFVARQWDRLLPHLSDTMTTASDFLRAKALEWGFPSERIWDAPVGADLEAFTPRHKDVDLMNQLSLRDPVLIYVGQLEVAGYAEQAVDVLARVRREFQTAKLLILGGGRKLAWLRNYTEERKLTRHVVFTDYISGDDVPRYLSLADVALAPFEENDVTRAKSPLKIAEYLAMGLPIVASDVGEAKTMTLGAGVCVPCGNMEDMSQKVIWLLHNPGIRRSMAFAGRKSAESRYNWKSHVDALESAYQFALKLYSNQ